MRAFSVAGGEVVARLRARNPSCDLIHALDKPETIRDAAHACELAGRVGEKTMIGVLSDNVRERHQGLPGWVDEFNGELRSLDPDLVRKDLVMLLSNAARRANPMFG